MADESRSEAELPLPQASELRAEFARWEWMAGAWRDLPADSRKAYDDWVLAGPSPRAASRRARAVTRRCYNGRPWAERPRRALQAVADFLTPNPDVPSGIDGTARG